ncbi:MAG: hypothetical protein K0R93_252 [Anaerosolibacter sp.]|uniref:hypothetical protein n=1 Tax=Anaerosolibacter sp. TaxID=1872527 RepID=UPI002618979A|nr:hypothetical protein [Anaerosolibacter sp.]MDF2545354.1 hypothetical protein [Anaerosolibacter sp.]
MKNEKADALEKALWSVALPGFGQLLNKKYFKALLLFVLEVIINVKSNLNTVIILSFYGDLSRAIQVTNYQWLMFYPCLYLFGIWDAYRDGIKEASPFLFLPFVLSAYTATVAVIYSRTFRIGNVLLGPIFLPILTIVLSMIIGFIGKSFLLKMLAKE